MTFNNFNEKGAVEINLPWDFSDDGDHEQELAVTATFTPGRPPRVNCSNDDADPGDPAEWSVLTVTDAKTQAAIPPDQWKDNEAFDEAVGEALIEDMTQHRHERAYARVGYP